MLILYYLFFLYCLGSLVAPFIHSGKWWLRVYDFPKLQFFIMALALIVIGLFLQQELGSLYFIVQFLMVSVAIYQAITVYQFTALAKFEVDKLSENDEGICSVKIISANINYQNEDIRTAVEVFSKSEHDILVLIEINQRLHLELKDFLSEYPYRAEEILEDGCGIAVYSKKEILDSKIDYLVSSTRPSIRAKIQIAENKSIKLYAIHPAPPALPKDDGGLFDSRPRDAELIKLGRLIEKEKDTDIPVVALGDFNDVAWSHTAKMFKRISGLMDPRVGRGFYCTYPVKWPIFRVPIDHAFLSNHFKMKTISILPDISSDHLALHFSVGVKHSAQHVSYKFSTKEKIKARKIVKQGIKQSAN